jgi:hypothetical protein
MTMDEVSALLERARGATGFDDFGDGSFREGLERLVASARLQGQLNAQGQALFEMQVVDLLSRRLEIEHWYARHPEIDDEQIVAPLIGLGLPRTGSTAFSCLLAEDPAVRSLRNWESQMPCPPPETATEHSDPRIAISAERMAFQDQLAPRLKAMLPLSPTSPAECQFFMGYDFKSQVFQATIRIPDYSRWLVQEADLVPTYRYVKRVLKLLQWRCPPYRWRLKNPSHMLFIDALDKVFPDARFWMTHRDITRVIPSVVDLYQELSRAYTDRIDIDHIAALNIEAWELGLHRVAAFRAAGHDDRFFDIGFAEFQQAPIEAIARLYTFLGETLTADARARMEAWRRDTPRDKHGGHDYDAADLGVDLDALRARFAFYTGAGAPAGAAA